jgi:hypothetical protein
MNCLAKPTQRTGKPEAPARASVPERFWRLKWNEAVSSLATSLRMSALGFNCGKGRAYSDPARLRDQFTGRKRRKFSTDLNQKTKTMSNDPEVPARSAAIKPTQALWQNSSK